MDCLTFTFTLIIKLCYFVVFRVRKLTEIIFTHVKKLKLILKNTIIHKKLTYAAETSTLTKSDRKQTFLKGKCIEKF
jgi:hypothetical protein